MAFIRVKHPEGGTQAINVDHITSVNYKRGEGELKSRISIEIAGEDSSIVAFGEEAEKAWAVIERLVVE